MSRAAPALASAPPTLERILGRSDLLLFSISAVLSIDTLASAASTGMAWFAWWLLTMMFFFIPYGLITAELGAAWPGEGGLHGWVSEGFGRRLGALTSWLYWINNAYWIPSVYLVFAATFDAIFGGSGDIWRATLIALVLTWLTVGIGVLRLRVSKWIPNLGALVKMAIFLALGVLGLRWLWTGRPPANAMSAAAFMPRRSDTLSFVPVLVYNTLGLELMSAAGGEMRAPERDVPRVVLTAALLISIIYALGISGILLAVPLGQLSVVTGIWDALVTLGRQIGPAGAALAYVLGIGFLWACIANIVTWSLGVNRVAATAAADGVFPALLGRLHPRRKTPYMAFAVMGVTSSVLLVGNALLSRTTANFFWLSFKLSGLCFLLSYVMVFPAFLRLRYRHPERPRPYRLPGGMLGAWAATFLCTGLIALCVVLFFKPSPTSISGEGVLLGIETALTVVAGLWLTRPRRG